MVISAGELLILSAIRINVVFALILASLVGSAAAGLGFPETMNAFLGDGLANGAKLAFNYAMLGAFFVVISCSGTLNCWCRSSSIASAARPLRKDSGVQIHASSHSLFGRDFPDASRCRTDRGIRTAGTIAAANLMSFAVCSVKTAFSNNPDPTAFLSRGPVFPDKT